MLRFLRDLLKKILRRLFSAGRKKKVKQPSGLKHSSQKVAYPYALAVFLFLALQGVLATGGALHLVFPSLPTPITFANGRAMHLNLGIFWPLLGIMGSTYYFLVEVTSQGLYSTRVAGWGFWYLLGVGLGILGSLALGYTDGREYLEAPFFLKIALLAGLLAFVFNLLATAIKNRALQQPEVIVILSGALLSALLYFPTIFFIPHPTLDDVVRFQVVHLWKRAAWNSWVPLWLPPCWPPLERSAGKS
ncbi:MAG: cbb3-type cytochrome c oxidase subunit I [Thermoanaerobacteraceae bacterium]|nr:cbb3-type cytochrome c oxidase subunit I [Thermoanaerobacteraceae bacterium]